MNFQETFGVSASVRSEAPGRVNLIGEHTDYNGGLVLPIAVELRTRASLLPRGDGLVRGRSRELGWAQAELDQAPDRTWLDYVRGTALALADAGRVSRTGFDLYVESDLPPGSGLSSSAALEVAVAFALCGAAGAAVAEDERIEIARLCRRAEGAFVGVPCGLMDPFAVACARQGVALELDCSDETWRAIPVPESWKVLVVDTGARRELRAGGYATRLAECERALQTARAELRCSAGSLSALAGIGVDDRARIERALEPAPFRRLRHVLSENERVRAFSSALVATDAVAAGQALYGSHESLRVDYEVSWDEADALVEASREIEGVIGARLIGAGWGGCTLHLVHAARAAACSAALVETFRVRFGRSPRTWLTRAAAGCRLL